MTEKNKKRARHEGAISRCRVDDARSRSSSPTCTRKAGYNFGAAAAACFGPAAAPGTTGA